MKKIIENSTTVLTRQYVFWKKIPIFRSRRIPSILQGEVASLNRKFVARLNNAHQNSSGDVNIIVDINDPALPPVKPL